MTALEKLAIELNPTDAYTADEFYNTIRYKCPDDVFPDVCICDGDVDKFSTCVQCWLQEVSE